MVQSAASSERQRTESTASRATVLAPKSIEDKNLEAGLASEAKLDQPQYQESRRGSAWSEAITRVGSFDLSHGGDGKKAEAPAFETIAEKVGELEARRNEPTVLELPADQVPTNLPFRTKFLYLSLASIVFFNGAFGSSVASGASVQYMEELGMTKLRSAAVLSMYMVGYVLAPSCWGPLSERKGRKAVNMITLPMFFFFNIGGESASQRQHGPPSI